MNSTKVKLPITDKPSIYSGIHYAYPCAIVESDEIAILTVNQTDSKTWAVVNDDLDVVIDGNEIRLLKKNTSSNVRAFLWRKFEATDEVALEVNDIKIHKKHVDLFLFSGDPEFQSNDVNECGIRWSLPGYTIKGIQHDYDTYIFKYVKIHKEDDIVVFYGSSYGEEWVYLDETRLPEHLKNVELKVGLEVEFGVDRFNEWKYMNFIQLTYNDYNIYKGMTLDYYLYPRKYYDNSFSFFGIFLNTYYDLYHECINLFPSIHDFLHWNIQNHYYVNLCLNEYYVPQRECYQKKYHEHYNLFFGFDDEKRVYYVLGYGSVSKPVVSEIPYEILDNENIVVNEYVVRFKYEPDCISEIEFNINPVIRQIEEYVNSVDSSQVTCNLIPGEKLKYGISVLKYMADNEEECGDVCRDLRITYMLNERHEIMSQRLEYLFNNHFLKENEFWELCNMNSELRKASTNLMYTAIKGKLKKVDSKVFSDQLMEMYEKDKEFCNMLIHNLRMY